jgi:hypothetical protein
MSLGGTELDPKNSFPICWNPWGIIITEPNYPRVWIRRMTHRPISFGYEDPRSCSTSSNPPRGVRHQRLQQHQ